MNENEEWLMGRIDQEIFDRAENAAQFLRVGLDGIIDFCRAYADAVENFGKLAERAFELRFPCFGKREWGRFKLVASGELEVWFLFRSDSFVKKLLRRADSKELQESICKNTPEGSAEVSRNVNRTRRAKFGLPWKVVGKGRKAHIHVKRVCDLGILDLENMRRKLEAAMKEG